MKKLTDKVAVITGAGSGMGQSAALLFAAEGANVVVADIKGMDETVAMITEQGGQAMAVEMNVASADSIRQAAEAIHAQFGPVDILYNNAGILDDFKPVLDMSEEEWDRVMDIDLKGVFLCTKAFLPDMLASGRGVVINTASIAGVVAGGGGTAYTPAKHGVIGFTKQLAYDYGKQGIRANAICPGAIETGMTRDIMSDVEKNIANIPVPRVAKAEEVARVALFLASDDASYIHGASIIVDGGWTIM